jgi:hypothetical protein
MAIEEEGSRTRNTNNVYAMQRCTAHVGYWESEAVVVLLLLHSGVHFGLEIQRGMEERGAEEGGGRCETEGPKTDTPVNFEFRLVDHCPLSWMEAFWAPGLEVTERR